MRDEVIDIEEQIERCRRLAQFLTDDRMRDALRDLAEDYEARLQRRRDGAGEGFMLREDDG